MAEPRIVSIDLTHLVEAALRGEHRTERPRNDAGPGGRLLDTAGSAESGITGAHP